MTSLSAQRRLSHVCLLLRITYALLFILVGGDKFFNITTSWQIYVNPHLMLLLPFSVSQFLAFFGVLQIIIGMMMLSPWALWGMVGALVMLIGIFINLMSMQGGTVVLVHDLFMIITLTILILLTITQKASMSSWWVLKIAYGILFVIAGADKFLNLVTHWENYSSMHCMQVAGVIEIALGFFILSSMTRLGAYLAAIWLLLISLNLSMLGYFDIAVRDVVMAVGAVALGQLTAIKDEFS